MPKRKHKERKNAYEPAAKKRRLSEPATETSQIIEATESETFKKPSRRTKLRSKQSDDKSDEISNAELSDIYKNCLELSTKNRINKNNAWGLKLIDYIQEVVNNEVTKEDKLNFQAASITLGATMKIYANRIDSMHTDAYRVWGGLANSDVNDDEEDEDTGNDENKTKKRASRKNKPIKGVDTIAKSDAAINAKGVQLEFAIDPLFKKTSNRFDAGGSKGLLLNTLNVSTGCEIIFDSSDATKQEEYVPLDPETDAEIDISLLVGSIKVENVENLTMCPEYGSFEWGSKQVFNLDEVDFDDIDDDSDSEDFDNFDIDIEAQERQLEFAQEAVEVSTPKPPRKKRKTTYIDFDTPSKTRKKLVKKHFTKPARDSETLLTTKMIQTQKKKHGDLLLPNDLQYDVSVFTTLFNKPAWKLTKSAPDQDFADVKIDNTDEAFNDVFVPEMSMPEPLDDHSLDNVDGPDPFEDSFPDGPDMENEDPAMANAPDPLNDPNLEVGIKMIDGPQKTKTVNINYARTAKLVNVKALKKNLWYQMLDGEKEEKLTSKKDFQEVLSGLHTKVDQTTMKQISVPYCFICLLHLANEHGLKIDTEGLNSLSIS